MVGLEQILNEVLTPALGCTEIGAVGLAAAHARAAAAGSPRRLAVTVDINTYKNASEVIIPRSGGRSGVDRIAALAVLYGDPALGLELFRNLTPSLAGRLGLFGQPGTITVTTCTKAPPYVDVKLETDDGWGRAVISGAHARLVKLESHRGIVVKKGDRAANALLDMTVHQIVRLAAEPDPASARLLMRGMEMNTRLARAGLSRKMGLALGAHLQGMIKSGLLGDDAANESRMLVAAAVDARMAGIDLPAMTNGGSGNQGIATVIPISVLARRWKSPPRDLVRALALGNLLAAYTKLKMGVLTTLCGSGLAAAIGASAGILWLTDQREEYITREARTIVANITGMLCGGANETCALKLATCSGVAVESAFLNLRQGVKPARAAILGETIEDTIENLSCINRSMAETDRTMLRFPRPRT
jgi:L-cysteine desulfidase